MPEFHAGDGVAIHFRDEGSGAPIVLVHGWTMSGRFFERQFEGLTQEFRVIAPDLRGCGASGGRAGTYQVPRYAKDLAELFEHLELREATLVGWSMGGGIAIEYLRAHGIERVRAVGLVDFPPKLDEDPSVADKVCHNLAKRRESFTRDFLARMFLAPRDDLGWMVEEALKCETSTACDMYRAMRPARGPDAYPFATLPAFLAFPPRGWFPKALAEWKHVFPRHTAPSFEASKHCPFLEEPAAFNDAMRAFVAEGAP
ncbi:MAG: alpha/beta hydrolase [Euryarchaeota archaeon]|nr:alpha/beta hydrolase [Euryarchaeota archaeon]